MTASSFTLRINGNIAFTDNSSDSFTEFFDGKFDGRVVNSQEAFDKVFDNAADEVRTFLETIVNPGTIEFTKTEGTSKAITNFNMHVSGQVANDDNSSTGFDFELNTDNEIINHLGTNALNTVNNVDQLRATVEQAFSNLLDPDSLIITPA